MRSDAVAAAAAEGEIRRSVRFDDPRSTPGKGGAGSNLGLENTKLRVLYLKPSHEDVVQHRPPVALADEARRARVVAVLQ